MHGNVLLCATKSTEDCTLVNALDTLTRVMQVQPEVGVDVSKIADLEGKKDR